MADEIALPELAQAQLKEQSGGPSADHIRSVFERYAALFSAADADAVAALYAPDAVVRDPITAPPVQGREAIRAWYQSAFDAIPGGMAMALEGAVRIAGPYGAAAFTVRFANGGQAMMTETLDVMRFDESGLIASMDAYFGPANFHPG